MRPLRLSFPPFKPALLIAAFFLQQLRPARAENAVSYKYVDYREADDRMAVESHYGLLEADLGTDMRLKVEGVIDAIAGATPTGQPPTATGDLPMANIHDRRKAWSADLARQFPRVNASVGFANSRESDYVSNGWSLNTLTDFNEKNTTLLLGVAGTDDDIRVFYQSGWAKKRSTDLIAGVTQLLDAQTMIAFNLGYGRSTGYHADPYRVIEQRTEIVPGVFLPLTYGENRPAEREKWTGYVALNRALPGLNAALEASYRLLHDTFGVTAHTLELAWFQKVGSALTLRPGFRFYDQTAADFYRIDITGESFTPTGQPMPAGPFYSADYRLSALRSYNYSLKAIWTVNAQWQLDAAIERYEMRGKDHVTSPKAYPRAVTFTAGARFAW